MAKKQIEELRDTPGVYQVEDMGKEKESRSGGPKVKVIRQQELPHRVTNEDDRYFRFIPTPLYVGNWEVKEDAPRKVRPFKYFLHQIPPRWSPIVCSGKREVIEQGYRSLDSDNCKGCEHAQTAERAVPRAKYVFLVLPCDDAEMGFARWHQRMIKSGNANDATEENYVPELILFEMGPQLHDQVEELKEEQKGRNDLDEDDDVLSRYRIIFSKKKGPKGDQDVEYKARLDPDEVNDPYKFTKGEIEAINQYTVGSDGNLPLIADVRHKITPQSIARQEEIIARALSSGDTEDDYDDNRRGSSRKVGQSSRSRYGREREFEEEDSPV